MISEAGCKPYIRKTGGKRYIALKRGGRERSVRLYSEDLWKQLDTEWALATYGKPSQPEKPQPLTGEDAQRLFKLFSEGEDPATAVVKTGLTPDLVELAVEKYMRLKNIPVGYLDRRVRDLEQHVRDLDQQVDQRVKSLNLEKQVRGLGRRVGDLEELVAGTARRLLTSLFHSINSKGRMNNISTVVMVVKGSIRPVTISLGRETW